MTNCIHLMPGKEDYLTQGGQNGPRTNHEPRTANTETMEDGSGLHTRTLGIIAFSGRRRMYQLTHLQRLRSERFDLLVCCWCLFQRPFVVFDRHHRLTTETASQDT